ncbi:ArsR/SmtB family transcription factor [Convivina intestini]|uniref:DNA-binding transcriptional ArsR family regulator n=1 Tax=Convivina intestini TaxID=1505726 RepID=A0A2U1DF29_9LACO|nr:metalloregulator ArsR/SmtB family transcription factor [Convivina intestini]PVY86287.1 DNA-binding transcriptional ArsR family regulator [Convivina intestini]CAH1851032.1 hypothetical protein R077811_00211 [Convivina intestini]SDB82191.1 ArsR family transcriptional regulator [Leuconostocaceae bacterium R-53105]
MKLDENIFKALANQTRIDILAWLKNPEVEFTDVPVENIRYMLQHFGGICGSSIVTRSGLSQSTISNYLKILVQVDLVQTERHGKWTYYRRNESMIQNLGKNIQCDL